MPSLRRLSLDGEGPDLLGRMPPQIFDLTGLTSLQLRQDALTRLSAGQSGAHLASFNQLWKVGAVQQVPPACLPACVLACLFRRQEAIGPGRLALVPMQLCTCASWV